MSWNDDVIREFRAGTPRVADKFDLEALILHTTGQPLSSAATADVLTEGPVRHTMRTRLVTPLLPRS